MRPPGQQCSAARSHRFNQASQDPYKINDDAHLGITIRRGRRLSPVIGTPRQLLILVRWSAC